MLSYERRQAIRDIIKKQGIVEVEDLAARFDVSSSTIRRDLDKLSSGGGIRRTYGGALLEDNRAEEPPIILRERENTEAKQRIGKAAAGLLKNGMTVIMDASSTVCSMVPFMSVIDNLTVVTSGVQTAYQLNAYANINTYCTGGRMRKHNMSLVGMGACHIFHDINADAAFISCRGISLEKGLTEASEEETQVKQEMLKAAARVVLLIDSTKVNQVLMNRICSLDVPAVIVTDKKLPAAYEDFCREKGISLLYA